MPRLALYTFAVMKDVPGSETVAGFWALAPRVFAAAQTADGFIAQAPPARSGSNPGADPGPWGDRVAPRFYTGSARSDEVTMVATLSLWRDIEAARQFSYGGLHREALRRRREWAEHPRWPSYVLWWVADDEVPSWAEAARRLEALDDDGPTAASFDFKVGFDPAGRPIAAAAGNRRTVMAGSDVAAGR